MRAEVGLGVGLLLLSLLPAGCGQTDAAAVSQQRAQLASTVAEGRVLALGAAGGRLTTPFVAVRASELGDDAREVESTLSDGPVAPGARAEGRRLRAAAHLVVGVMDRLHRRPADRALASHAAGELEAVAGELSGP